MNAHLAVTSEVFTPCLDLGRDSLGGPTTMIFRCGLLPGNKWATGYAQHPFSRTTERLAIAAPTSVQICGFIFCLKGDCKRRELPHYRRLFREAIQSGRGWLDRILPLRPDNKFVFIFEGTPNALDIHGYLSICEDLCEMVKMTYVELYQKGTLSVAIK